ncbi:MAG: hypothetical protein B6U77_02865 [Candidatus Hecatellales archaeon ex4484_218]|nr:MAG: hypothetical protein B6U77_02865 [Candidatus Hecatellales archaeon ex4484_218]
MKVAGVDLAGSPTRPTGFCILDMGLYAKTKLLYKDEEIVNEILAVKPTIVSIDAPLALPRGRCCLKDDCQCRKAGHLRECDKVLLKLKIKFFPLTLGPMRKLTLRGINLTKILSQKGFKVIESFPNSIKIILGFPGKKEGLEKLRKALIDYGIKGDINKKKITEHELDAILSALVGKLYLEGKAVEIGDPDEALMVIPNPKIYNYLKGNLI